MKPCLAWLAYLMVSFMAMLRLFPLDCIVDHGMLQPREGPNDMLAMLVPLFLHGLL